MPRTAAAPAGWAARAPGRALRDQPLEGGAPLHVVRPHLPARLPLDQPDPHRTFRNDQCPMSKSQRRSARRTPSLSTWSRGAHPPLVIGSLVIGSQALREVLAKKDEKTASGLALPHLGHLMRLRLRSPMVIVSENFFLH